MRVHEAPSGLGHGRVFRVLRTDQHSLGMNTGDLEERQNARIGPILRLTWTFMSFCPAALPIVYCLRRRRSPLLKSVLSFEQFPLVSPAHPTAACAAASVSRRSSEIIQ